MKQRTCTGQPITSKSEILTRPSFSSDRKNDDMWSSQVWKSGRMSRTGTEKSVINDKVIDIDKDSDTAAESDLLSLRTLSFRSRVNNRLRKMLNRSSEDKMKDIDKRSLIWSMFMSSTLEAFVFLGQNYLDNLHSTKIQRTISP